MKLSSIYHAVLHSAAPFFVGAVLFSARHASAQLPPVNGMRPTEVRAHAIVDATVIPAPGQKLEHATIVIRDGVIEAVGPMAEVAVPADARVWSGDGMTVYPGLIDAAVLVRPGDITRGAGSHWNTRIRPEVSMLDMPAPDQSLRKDLRSMGFAAAAVYPSTGAIRGSGVFIALADESEHVLAYRNRTAMAMAFDFGGGRRGGGEGGESSYPGSLMGSLALLRQTLHDAQWHNDCRRVWNTHPAGNEPPIRADALAALADVLGYNGSPSATSRQPVLFDVSDELNALRAAKLAREFNLDMVLLGSGYEFRELNAIVASNLPIIVPLDFPKRPDVSTLSAADSVSLRDLMTWEQAPTNVRRLVDAGATVALTTHRLRSRNDFHANLRTAIKHGLSEDAALAALTTTPAKLLGVDHTMGTIEHGKVANLVVVKGSLFAKDGKIYDTWVNGRRFEINKDAQVQLKGSGTLTLEGIQTIQPDGLKVDLDTIKSTVTIHLPEKKKVTAKKVIVQQDQVSFVTDGRPFQVEGYVRFSGVIEGQTVTGTGAMPDGSMFRFVIEIKPKADGEKDAETDNAKSESEPTEGEMNEPADENAPAATDKDSLTGTWSIRSEQMPPDVVITLRLQLEQNTTVTGAFNAMGEEMELSNGVFDPATGKFTANATTPDGGPATVEATVSGDSMNGKFVSATMNTTFSGSREGGDKSGGAGKDKKAEEKFVMPPNELNYPLGEYGLTSPPTQRNVLVRGATIWTAGPEGMLQEGDLFIENGRIKYVGPTVSWAWGAGEEPLIIEARGKHITPGLIDCHSHTGINGSVNEMAQTNTAECRIADCIDPTDINWYRQLAGGLTACNQLHGSANPIGGQNSVVKLKFAAADGPDAFPIQDAISGIKFALGENVKRSTNRYPNTRMGVETFIRDAFTAAAEYRDKWDRYRALSGDERARTMPPQRNLELDALVEILEGKRLVHCHSYRQDEILMLIRVAESFGFTIGTFQHVLEGYKVAEAIGRHGAGASSFSDWWAYKIEVIDAIPYNGSLMNNVGVLVSFNSDSDELARRMNTEAAKAVRYGEMEPHEALKFVTINPAKQLRIDNRTGSLEQGKDADFVIWSGDPLSTYSRCEQTWIEGAKYFDLETDKQLREQINTERQRLIQKILVQAHGETPKPGEEAKSDDTAGEGRPGSERGTADRPRRRPPQEVIAWLEEQVRMGRDPDEARPGVCGCDDQWTHEH